MEALNDADEDEFRRRISPSFIEVAPDRVDEEEQKPPKGAAAQETSDPKMSDPAI